MKIKAWLVTLASLAVFVSPAVAATAPPPPVANPGQGLEISPPVIQQSANPGQTVNVTVKLRDISAGPLVVTGKADDFGAKDETGNPEILLNEQGATRFSLKYWIASVPSFTLQSQQEQVMTIPIVVPANAEPGGHYGVIRFTGLPPGISGTGVSLSASIGALVLLRVNGAINEQLDNAQFFASQGSWSGNFFEHGPITLNERIKNTGNVHVQPVGQVKVYDTFGRRIAQLSVNDQKGSVLPDSIRKFNQTLNKWWLFGRYRATYNVTYGSSANQLGASLVFWVIPWRLIIMVTVVLFLVVIGLRSGLRRYNRYIVGRARR